MCICVSVCVCVRVCVYINNNYVYIGLDLRNKK